ncbi:MAG: hypothetical protein C0462_10380 [Alcanivorax sp.]|nr:hypothetical protein [Alcanivorax sp.]
MMSEALQKAQQCLMIHSVNLRDSTVMVRLDIDPWSYDRASAQLQSYRHLDGVQEVELQVEGQAETSWEYRCFYALGNRFVGAEADTAGKEPVVDIEIAAVFQARYLCKRQLEKEELAAFAKDNVGFHVWPYWREFVQSSCNRIGLPSPIDVPMYSISKS